MKTQTINHVLKNVHIKHPHKPHVKVPHWLQHTLLGLMSAFLLVNLAGMLYPKDRTFFFVNMSGFDFSNMSKSQIIEELQSISSDAQITITAQNKKQDISLFDLGVEIDAEASAELAIAHRSSWYLPIVSAYEAYRQEDLQPVFKIDEEKLDQEVEYIIANLDKKYQNAQLVVKEGEAEIQPHQDGYKYSKEQARADLISDLDLNSSTVELYPKLAEAVITTEAANQAKTEYQRLLSAQFSITANNQNTQVQGSKIAQWIKIEDKPKEQVIAVELDPVKVAGFVRSFASNANINPTNTVVKKLDGQEQSRIKGESGKVVDEGQATLVLINAIEQNKVGDSVKLPVVPKEPSVIYNNSYSATNQGLKILLDDWRKKHSADFGIVVQEIGGQNRYASHQADKLYVTASTYKMFLAYTILKEVDDGDMKLSDKSGLSGWTVGACIQEMIRNSTNPCAVALGDNFGWQKATNMVRAAGFSSTNLRNGAGGGIAGHKWSTPTDEANFLRRLNAGELLSSESTNLLLGHMKSQRWRDGIPRGVASGVVADKVGFWGTYRHDVAIVYSPNGTYVLTIMTQWGAEWQLAELSKEIYNYFN